MRGKVLLRHILACHLGITPAYAGKSGCSAGIVHRWQDHPRLCGEKVMLKRIRIILVRITPAYAGKSRKQSDCHGHK